MRRFWVSSLIGTALLAAGAAAYALAQSPPTRIFFQVAAGSSSGRYFSVGETLAGLISHPPGLARCEGEACGPEGLIVSVRLSLGAAANIREVETGASESGLTHSVALAEALNGVGAFKKTGKTRHVRVIAALFDEPVHLVAARRARIARVGDLRGKTVSLGGLESGTVGAMRNLLYAYGLLPRRYKSRYEPSDRAAALLRQGKLDAFFYVGAPSPAIRDLLAKRIAVLLPLDGAGRAKAVAKVPGLTPTVIPAGTYPGTNAVPTLNSRALWVVRDNFPPALIYGLLHALFSKTAGDKLAAAGHPLAQVGLASALKGVPTTLLHPGAQRFYRERKLIK